MKVSFYDIHKQDAQRHAKKPNNKSEACFVESESFWCEMFFTLLFPFKRVNTNKQNVVAKNRTS